MSEWATLYDTQDALVESATRHHGGYTFEIQLNDQMTGYTLTVSSNENVATFEELPPDILDLSGEDLCARYT